MRFQLLSNRSFNLLFVKFLTVYVIYNQKVTHVPFNKKIIKKKFLLYFSFYIFSFTKRDTSLSDCIWCGNTVRNLTKSAFTNMITIKMVVPNITKMIVNLAICEGTSHVLLFRRNCPSFSFNLYRWRWCWVLFLIF